MARRRPKQLALTFRTWGGKRPGAGRKASPERVGFVPHVRRPALAGASHPVHVSMRTVARGPNLRSERIARAVFALLARSVRDGFRVVHFSIQTNHLHFVVEAPDRARLWRGVQRLASTMARKINRTVGRSGRLFRDRYHRHDLKTPREVRNALVYVVMNVKKHDAPRSMRDVDRIIAFDLDPLSSAAWVDGWTARAGPRVAALERALTARGLLDPGRPPVAAPRTWLARSGWKRRGLLDPSESPS